MKVRATFNIDPVDAEYIKGNKLQIGNLIKEALELRRLMNRLK
jgi:hypothetical protein